MPACSFVLRRVGAAFAAVLLASTPLAAGPLGLPAGPVVDEGGVVRVENRLIPRWLGGDRQQRVELPDGGLDGRVSQLETQVRNLTTQVEQLTFALRRLEAAMADQGSRSGAGAAQPARTRLPQTVSPPISQHPNLPTHSAAPAQPSGPVDLSALNTGTPSASQQPVRTVAPAPTGNDELSRVRSLYQSGRYAMAQQEAEAMLAKNPSGAVAGEARYMLGQALLAQGDYREAANQFLENYTSDPNGSRAPASLLKLGTSLNGLGESEAACSSLEELFNVYPNVDGQLRADAERERRAANCV